MDRPSFHARFAYALDRCLEVARVFVHDRVRDAAVLDLVLDVAGDPPSWRAPFPEVCDEASQEGEVPLERALEILWRKGSVPRWVYLAVRSAGSFKTRVLCLASEDYVEDEDGCVVQYSGLEPFHVLAPMPPPSWESLLRDGAFSLDAWRRPRWDRLEQVDLERHVPDLRLPGLCLDREEAEGLTRFWDLRTLVLDDAVLGEGALEVLPALGKLEHLCLDRTAVNDAAASILGRMTGLRALSLGATSITDAGVRALTELSGLRFLRLADTPITGACLRGLEGLGELEWLDLSGTSLQGSLAALSRLEGLEVLDLSGTAVDADSLEGLAGLPVLHALNLASTCVDDEAVWTLRSFPALRTLDMVDAPIGEGGLLGLLSDPNVLRNLERVRVREGLLGDELLARIREARSHTVITSGEVS